MENKICKKCGKELPDGSNAKLCEECQEKRKSIIRKILIGAGTVGFAATAVLAGLASRNREDGNDLDYEYDENDDESLANIGRAIDMMNGEEDYDDDFVQKWL